MKLARVGEPGAEVPVLLDEQGRRRDARACARDFDEHFFERGGLRQLARWWTECGASAPCLDPSLRLGPPLARPSKIVCVGLNYRDHALETGKPLPAEPVLFLKATSALAGPEDDLFVPRGATKLDWEVELGVVIGTRARCVEPHGALEHVAGYVVCNDYSERAFQNERGGQWSKGKSCDGFAPLGPWLATRDEIPDPQALELWLDVNDVPRQRGHSSQMVVSVARLVSYISQFMTLLPGDLISTGTPAGVGLGQKPPLFLAPGDVVRCGIAGLGAMRQRIREPR